MKVIWNEKTCMHSGECVKDLPEVFKIIAGKFIIDTTQANDEEIRKIILKCPSMAFEIVDTNS